MSGRLSRILDDLQSKLTGGSNDTHISGSQAPQDPSNNNGMSARQDSPHPYPSSTPHAPSNTHPSQARYSAHHPNSPPAPQPHMSQPQYVSRPKSPNQHVYNWPNPQTSAFYAAQVPSAPSSDPPIQPLYGLTPTESGGLLSSYQSAQYSPSPPAPAPSVPRVFSILPSPFSPQTVSIHQAGLPNSPPLYFLTTSTWTPQVTMIQGDNHATIGQAHFSFPGTSIDLSLRGQPVPMRRNLNGGAFTVEGPMGTLNWNVGLMSRTVSDLVDANGVTVARYNWSGIPGVGAKSLELWVLCGQPFIELVLLSLLASTTINGENTRTGRMKHSSTMGDSSSFGRFASSSGGGGSSSGGGGGGD